MVSTFIGSLQVLDGILGALPGALAWAGGAFSALGGAVHSVVDRVGELLGALGRVASAINDLPSAHINIPGIPGFQHGGVALPGSLFRVGEAGPELGYALPGGGVVISPGAGGEGSSKSITVNISGATMGPLDERAIVALIRRYDLLHG